MNAERVGHVARVTARKRDAGVLDVFMYVGNDDPRQIGRIERYKRPEFLDDDHSPKRGWTTWTDDARGGGIAATKAEALIWLARRNGVREPVFDAGRVLGWVSS